LRRADGYFGKERYKEAVIEYMNVLRIDPADPDAIRQSGLAHYHLGDFRKAVPFLLKCEELEPENTEVRIKLGTLYLWGRRLKKARAEASYVLERHPDNFDALLLLADTAFAPEQLDDMLARLQSVAARFEDRALFHIALGNIHLRKKDMAAAEAAYNKAVAADATSPEAHLALGQIYKVQGDRSRAEQEYKTAADLSSPNSRAWIKWASFKQEAGEVEEAKTILERIVQENPDSLPALVRLARIAYTEKRHDDCINLVDRVLKKQPAHFEAMLLHAAVRLARRETDQAIDEYERLAARYPKVAQLSYQLALAQVQKGRIRKAIDELNKAVEMDGEFTKAALLLAELNIRTGNAAPAVTSLKQILAREPDLGRAYFLLGMAYRVQKMPDQALDAYRKLKELAPDRPQWPYLIGVVLLGQDKKAEAAAAFQESLDLAPSFVLPLVRLIAMDIRDNKSDAALERLQKQIEIAPESPSLRYVLGKLHAGRGEMDLAEKAVLKAIDLQPEFIGAYRLLSTVYAATGKDEQAISKLSEALKVNPNDQRSMMISAALRQRRDEIEEACQLYEKVLTLNPRSAPAANNLAYLYSERLDNQDRAYDLALKAKDLAPDDPFIADTLGWILCKRGQHKWALNLLQDSAEQLPDQPEILYHLGKVNFALGHEQAAADSFQKALNKSRDFPGSADAELQVKALGIKPSEAADPEVRAALTEILDKEPDNPAALVRLAALEIQAANTAQATAAYHKALATHPAYLPAIIGLAELYAQDNATRPKALDLARKARELAPEDPGVAHTAGWIAFQSRDYKWALSLLQESAAALKSDPTVLYHQGMASYMLGNVPAARKSIQQAVDLAADFPDAKQARQLLALTAGAPGAVIDQAQAVLESDPDYLPGLMVMARVQQDQGEPAAQKSYEMIVGQYPEFAPAAASLAGLYLLNKGDLNKAFDLVMKARGALPDDPAVTSTLGAIVCMRGDHGWAARLLQESATKRPDDPQIFYYLGLARHHLKEKEAAAKALQRCLELAPDSPNAADAKGLLSELQ